MKEKDANKVLNNFEKELNKLLNKYPTIRIYGDMNGSVGAYVLGQLKPVQKTLT